MKFVDYLVCFRIFLLTLHLKIGLAVPPEYCLHQLNTSDCKATPTPVFFYYKPGSRCELDTWRGCPTYNRFDEEFQCISTCIHKHRLDSSENKIFKYEPPKTNLFLQDSPDYELNFEDELDTLPDKQKSIVQKILDNVVKTTVAPQRTPTDTPDYEEETNPTTDKNLPTTVGIESTREVTTHEEIVKTDEHTTHQPVTTQQSPTREELALQEADAAKDAEPTKLTATTLTEPLTEVKISTEPTTEELTTPTVVTTTPEPILTTEDDTSPPTGPTTVVVPTTQTSTSAPTTVVTEEITTTVLTTAPTTVVTEKITTTEVVSTTSGEADEVIIMRS